MQSMIKLKGHDLLYGYVLELIIEVCCGEFVTIGRRLKQSKITTQVNIEFRDNLHNKYVAITS